MFKMCQQASKSMSLPAFKNCFLGWTQYNRCYLNFSIYITNKQNFIFLLYVIIFPILVNKNSKQYGFTYIEKLQKVLKYTQR